ncbi:MAG: AbrB/MazE/SpoVT family DNA-binding domain-containing protein [Pseudomonadales bacterium]|nr:AbrB/MazE/SpoVT family DNA-binding domain-containing protein [Pseudomonadales bacterium]
MSIEVRLGEKGQVTLPKIMRDVYQLKKGDSLKLIDLGDGIMEVVLRKPSGQMTSPVVNPKESFTIDELNEAVQVIAAKKNKI